MSKVEISKPKVENPPAPIDPAKKLRNLKKLLKAIEGLEAKLKSEEVVNLEPEQQEKLARKPEILKEIFSLEMEVNYISPATDHDENMDRLQRHTTTTYLVCLCDEYE